MIRTLLACVALATAMTAAQSAQQQFYPVSGCYPHDVAPAPDGSVWISCQSQGAAGHLDPTSGKLEKISLGQGAGPHGVIIGPDGAPWFTEGGQNAIARVDPATKKVDLWRLPKEFPNANLNTATFDKRGVIWFTGQAGVYGRLDPKVGKVEAWKAPRGSGAYGITTTPSGDVWFVSLASDYLAKVDIVTGAATVIDPPRRVGTRRVWSDSKGNLWVSFWTAGGLGKYDPVKAAWTHYPMPVSKGGTYAVYVDEKDHVWATDWSANAIQRFDPTTEKYDTFVSDKRGSSVRQMNGRPGELWGGESGNERLVVIRD
jgi:virginiamycin B lyase